MIQLTYEPALDPYHAIYRILRLRPIIKQYGPLPRDHVRILDFYQLFQFRIHGIRFRQQDRQYRRLASNYKTAAYGEQPEDRTLFSRMEPMQVAALDTLASHHLIDPDQWQIGDVSATDNPLPDDLAARVASANARDPEFQSFLGVLASEYPLTGVNGLKDRTGLMEYRHDAA
jgi:hypothetical protein